MSYNDNKKGLASSLDDAYESLARLRGTSFGISGSSSSASSSSARSGGSTAGQKSRVKVGDTVRFGKYLQDKLSDGRFRLSPIEWRVLEIQEDRALLISTRVLDSQKYHKDCGMWGFEESSLRRWLNAEFISWAFSESEESAIISTRVTTPYRELRHMKNPVVDSKIFVLTVDEAEKYFSSNRDRSAAITDYSHFRAPDGKCYYWWLRTGGRLQSSVGFVADDGVVSSDGTSCFYDNIGVRPAMWVRLDKITQ